PFYISDELLQKIKADLPELPEAVEDRYVNALNISTYDAATICSEKEQVDFFEAMIDHTTNHKAAANWLLGPIKSYLNDSGTDINSFKVPPSKIAALIGLVESGKLSFSIAATKIFSALLIEPMKDPLQIATEL